MPDQRSRVISLDPPDPYSPEEVATPLSGPLHEELVHYVRAIYVGVYREFTGKHEYGRDIMPAWDGGETQFGRRCSPIWPKIAARIVETGADPVGFIRAQFWCRRTDSRPPSPTYLLSAEATARYGAYLQQAPAVARREYEADLQVIQGEVLLLTSRLNWEYSRAVSCALRNNLTVRASALFRYCLAVAENLTDLAQRFHDQALLQYVFQQEILDVAWGDRIPAALREECVRLRAQILGRA